MRRSKIIIAIVASMISGFIALSAVSASAAQSLSPHCTTASGAVCVGVHVPGGPSSFPAYETWGNKVTRPDVVLYFSTWGTPFRTQFAQQAAAYGATTLVQMTPPSQLWPLVEGKDDTYLTAFAHAVASLHVPVIIGWAHEMNMSTFPYGWKHVGRWLFIHAWRHVVGTFRAAGATNVIWLWTLYRWGPGWPPGSHAPLWYYWPGSWYVTWIGLDAYYFHPWQTSIAYLIGESVTQIRHFTRDPILLAENGAVWWRPWQVQSFFTGVRHYHLLGVVWNDVLGAQDWRLEGHPRAIAAFRRGALSIGY